MIKTIFKQTIFLVLFYQSVIFSNYIKNLPKPYSDLTELLPFNNHGWYSNPIWIEKLMKNNKITIALEVGSWLGLSTRHIASLLQPNGKLYAVDTWQGSVEHQENFQQTAAMLPTLYQQFLSNMIHAKLTDIVIPMKMTSLEAAPILLGELNKVNLIYIDAAHDTISVLNDIRAYFPFIENNGGILCGDDWWHDPVKVAVRIFAQERKLTIYASDNFWFVKNEGVYAQKDFKNESIDIWKFDTLQ
jgi:predicted O-methyltransferase YrrM